MGSLIRTEDITKSYVQENQVLKGINLEIQEGEFVSILGESGSGKTTLLSILGGMEIPTTGKVFFKDQIPVFVVTYQEQDTVGKIEQKRTDESGQRS